MSEDPEAQRVKGKHTRAQLALWDAAVETRIRLQPVLQMANRLPQGGQPPNPNPTHPPSRCSLGP